jgi:hypothetical protein
MSLESDFKRDQAYTKMMNYQARFVAASSELDGIFSNLEQLAIDFPDDATEINGKITAGKNLLQNVINNH